MERKQKEVQYCKRMRASRADELYIRIYQRLIVEKKYRDPDYSAHQLACDLHTNTRYVSSVLRLRFQDNYTGLVNEYRVRDACQMLDSPRYRHLTIEEIGLSVGYMHRQSFYNAFLLKRGIPPGEYRERQAVKSNN